MDIYPESAIKAFRVIILTLLVIMTNFLKEELGVNQPRQFPEPGLLIERFEKTGKPVEPKCLFTLVYEGRWPEPCPIESHASYRLYRDWKRRNGLK